MAPHIDRELDVRGVEYGAHRAKQVTERMIAESALVLVMEKEHLRWLVHEWPQYRSKIYNARRSLVPQPGNDDIKCILNFLNGLLGGSFTSEVRVSYFIGR